MSTAQIWAAGQQRLARIETEAEGINTWKAYLANYRPRAKHADDACVWLTCVLALEAVNAGNNGIGSILVDSVGRVVAQGHNAVFNPYFRSDRHAEMVVMDDFEDAHPELGKLHGYALFTSLEPCPMCLVRLGTSGVKKVLFAASDAAGGMAHKLNDLPPFWIELLQGKMFSQAECSPGLAEAAGEIFLLNLEELTARIKAR
ncbi:MAG: nucleoside deaminase [Gammaproteobacteria bacterium]|nr:nucleoside deaminase [Gammaproteobacteria bacterium]